MERCNSIFGQILQIFSKREFFEAVYDTKAEKGIRGFGVWDHFVAMLRFHLDFQSFYKTTSGHCS